MENLTVVEQMGQWVADKTFENLSKEESDHSLSYMLAAAYF